VFEKVNTPAPEELDNKEIWQKALLGLPITEEEFDRM
jgi:hypothetical protein